MSMSHPAHTARLVAFWLLIGPVSVLALAYMLLIAIPLDLGFNKRADAWQHRQALKEGNRRARRYALGVDDDEY